MRSPEATRRPEAMRRPDAKSPLGHGLTAGIGSEGRKPWLRGSLHFLERGAGVEGSALGFCPGQRVP